MSVQRDDRFVQAEEVLVRDLNEVVLVMARGDRAIHSLTGAGTAIWRDLCAPVTLEQLVAKLANFFDLAAEVIDADVRRTVEDLVAARLVLRLAT